MPNIPLSHINIFPLLQKLDNWVLSPISGRPIVHGWRCGVPPAANYQYMGAGSTVRPRR